MRDNRYCFIPGPGTLPPAVVAAQAAAMKPDSGRALRDNYQRIAAGLKTFLGTERDVLLLPGTAVNAMETAVVNLVSPGEKALVIRCGYSGNRWAEILKEFGVMVRSLDVEWGRAVNPKLISERLNEDKGNEIRAVFATYVDVATGVANDIRGIAEAVKDAPALLVVDGSAGLGAMDFRMDEWGVDATIGVSYGAFMSPPGLAFISLSREAWKVMERCRAPRYAYDLRKYSAAAEAGTLPFTPPSATMNALRAALELMEEEGIQAVYDRHEKNARALRAAVNALTLRVFPLNPANSLTVIRPPDEIPADDLRAHLERLYGVAMGDGLAQLKGRVLRIGHAGAVTAFDIVTAVAALELGLTDKGFVFEPGAGVAAAEKVLKEV